MKKVIYANIMGANALSKNEKLFLSDLISYTQNKEYVFACNAHFAQLYGVTIRTINRWLAKLKKLELISTKLERYTKSFIVKKRYIYVNMDKVKGLNKEDSQATNTLVSDFVQYNKHIPKSEKHMLSVLIKYAQRKGYVYASDEHFAESFGVHKTTVSRWIGKLEDLGLIEVNQDRFIRRIFICRVKRQARKPAKAKSSFFELCKNVMYSVTSFIHARKRIILSALSNIIHNTS